MDPVLKFVHLSALAVWIGGMFFAHFCLRPAAFELLPPPQRVALLVGALGRFFRWVGVAILLLWASGLARMGRVGFAESPPAWHVMATLAAVMTAVFVVIVGVVFPKVCVAVASQRVADAAAGLTRVRALVAVNLALGFATIASAVLIR